MLEFKPCPKCGRKMNKGETCFHCGTPYGEEKPKKKPAAKKVVKKKPRKP